MNRRIGLMWKIGAGLALLILLTVAAVGLLAHPRIVRDAIKRIEYSLEQQANYLVEIAAPALRGEQPVDEFQAEVALIAARTDTRITVISADGMVLADSHEDPQVMENHLTRPEILDAERNGRGTSTRYSYTIESQMLYFALPVKRGGQTIGYVRTSIPLTEVDQRLASLRASLLFGIGFALLFSIPVGWFFTRRIIQPLIAMKQAATRIADGEYGLQVRLRSSDEIGELADALNHMSTNLAERLERISRDRSQLEAMLGSMAEGIIATDKDERIVHLNSVAADLCSVELDSSRSRRTWEVFRLPPVNDGIREAISSGRTVTREITFTQAPRDRLINMVVAPWRESGGAVVGAVAVLHDITRLRSLELIRQEFVSNASHELKSPVSAIRGLAETILDDTRMDPQTARRFTSNILDESIRLSTLVQDMLTLSRLEQRDQISENVRLDLCKVVKPTAQNYAATAENAQVSLKVECPDVPVNAMGSQFALETAVSNLVSNALNYTPEGGQVEVRLRTEGEQAVIEVRDTGIGIEPKHLDRIFERFYRVDKARSRQLGGTGLGLSIVKHTVLNSGGEVSVSSTPGQGSTFVIRLPLAPAAD